jgi:hypothetical protein
MRRIELKVRGLAAPAVIVASVFLSSAWAATWSPPVTVAAIPDGVRSPSVAVNASGIGVAAWIGGDQVMVAMRDAGGVWATAVPLSPGGQSAATPSVAVAPDGTAVVARGDRSSP